MTEDDPRARYRRLPEPVRPEDAVETEEASARRVVETPPEIALRIIAGGSSG
ncbi:hypothetical protein [uncultured Modestobacter sp.]|uniref:hypothetical protein n=1 Tax=uncultured Modestobacter sp. TaxID=380048 RepID=UPI00261EC285|nr:hypothetical protein [uncultured Modestobacter sp.]